MINRYGTVLFFLTSALYGKQDAGTRWRQIEKKAQPAVVQVRASIAEFNWLDPFRNAEQGEGAGTGFFIDKEGHLLTNYHVVRGAKSIFVTIPKLGQKRLWVTVVSVCPEVDVALLKLTAASHKAVIEAYGALTVLPLGDSDQVYSTEEVLAMGYPFVPSLKTTLGFIGGRDFLSGQAYLQTQTPINPGNSGGPLLHDKKGEPEVIGICTGALKNSENYALIVPINDVKTILKDLYAAPFVRRPAVSFGYNRASEEHARSLDNPVPGGVYIHYVQTNSMEDRAGMVAGDMLYEIDVRGKRYTVDEFGEVEVEWRPDMKISVDELLGRCALHDRITFVVYRSGKRIELSCIFEETGLPPVRTIYPDYEQHEGDYEIIGGMVFMQLRENHIRLLVKPLPLLAKYALPENQSKPVLIITRVLPGSIAYLSECVSQGSLVKSVNGRPVTTLAGLRDALLLSTTTKKLSLVLKDKSATVFDAKAIAFDEPRLSRDFKFPLTETSKAFITAFKDEQG